MRCLAKDEMNVLLLGPYPPPHGGIQTHLVALREFLLKQQIPCAVINLTRFRKVGSNGVYYPKTALEVFQLLLRLKYDVVHLHIGGNVTPRLLGLGLNCCLIPRARAVLTLHSGGYPSTDQGRTTSPFTFRGFVLRQFDGLIGVNPEIVRWFQRCGVPPQHTRLISPFPVPAAPSVNSFPKAMDDFYRQHSPVLITVGLLEPEYDLPLQIRVLGLVRSAYPRAGLIIVGSGTLEEDLRQQIRRTPYADHILLCGDVAHPVTLHAIEKSNLFLRTTIHDGDSVAVRECLHLGVPVIATDNGMRPGGVALIPRSDLDALYQAILDHLSRPFPRHRSGEKHEKNLEAVLGFYQELLAQAARAT